MRNTIKAQYGYHVRTYTGKRTGKLVAVVSDGDVEKLRAWFVSFNDYLDEMSGNECFEQYEVFTDVNGVQYVYFGDYETLDQYIAIVPSL